MRRLGMGIDSCQDCLEFCRRHAPNAAPNAACSLLTRTEIDAAQSALPDVRLESVL